MRNMSFMLTTEQVRSQTKTVTRRNGWRNAKAGDRICAVEKSQGLGKGGKIKRLCEIEIIDVRQEPLRRMTDEPEYGFAECNKEGFPFGHRYGWPSEFVAFFCGSHRGVTPDSEITRIEFKYLAPPAQIASQPDREG